MAQANPRFIETNGIRMHIAEQGEGPLVVLPAILLSKNPQSGPRLAAGDSIKIFFLACIILAGIFCAFTANRKILWAQALPGAIALILVWSS
jgi:uncharacterized membrane protein